MKYFNFLFLLVIILTSCNSDNTYSNFTTKEVAEFTGGQISSGLIRNTGTLKNYKSYQIVINNSNLYNINDEQNNKLRASITAFIFYNSNPIVENKFDSIIVKFVNDNNVFEAYLPITSLRKYGKLIQLVNQFKLYYNNFDINKIHNIVDDKFESNFINIFNANYDNMLNNLGVIEDFECLGFDFNTELTRGYFKFKFSKVGNRKCVFDSTDDGICNMEIYN